MLPSLLASQVRSAVIETLKATLAPSTKGFEDIVDRFLADESNFFRGPYLLLDLPFRKGKLKPGQFENLLIEFEIYKHQERAFDRLCGPHPRSTLIATGTGSGKTECFTYPLLEHCYQHRNEKGIKAILIYPMNALAQDQAGRLAKLIWANPKLKGKLRVGYYADREPEFSLRSAAMTQEGVITSRDEMRRSPPDVLITNYKMLDYLLVRSKDKPLWLANAPSTLRFLVVDELHTFDGAQGTDLACLLRRLKARLQIPERFLCCVGTSATLGKGSDATLDILRYASNVFGEEFERDALIGEERESAGEYLLNKDVELIDIPDERSLDELMNNLDSLSVKDFIEKAHDLWFGQDKSDRDIASDAWRIALGKKLDSHLFFQFLLRATRDGTLAMNELLKKMERKSYLLGKSSQYLNQLVKTLTALCAHARRPSVIQSIDSSLATTSPYFNLRVQLWIRELRRMVASVKDAPELLFAEDLSSELQQSHLPILHCRDCGATGWVTLDADIGRKFESDLSKIYRGYFGSSRHLRFIYRDCPSEKFSSQLQRRKICPKCLAVHSHHQSSTSCQACRDQSSSALLEIWLYIPLKRSVDGNVEVMQNRCPHCENYGALGIFGARSATLLSSSIAALFTSAYNDDPKLLTFSDSVQDAAQRAGFLETRAFKSLLRQAIYRDVSAKSDLPTLLDALELPVKLREQGGREKDEIFIATFTHPDLHWKRDYEEFIEEKQLSNHRLRWFADQVANRLEWEIFAELSYRSRNTQSLERSGTLSIHPCFEKLIAAAQELHLTAADRLGDSFRGLNLQEMEIYLFGVVDSMRHDGAVFTKHMEEFFRLSSPWFDNRTYYLVLPQLMSHMAQPIFPAKRDLPKHRNLKSLGKISNFKHWAKIAFLKSSPLVFSQLEQLEELALSCLVKAGLMKTFTRSDDRHSTVIWGLDPESLLLTEKVVDCKCCNCGQKSWQSHLPLHRWGCVPCSKLTCEGKLIAKDYQKVKTLAITHKSKTLRRLIAREHTAILDRSTRDMIEKGFKANPQKPWHPNVLCATSTLELGIDIGDLSCVALCSMPPEPANYTQRIGRTGRRDGNSLNITIVNGKSHDLYFWSQPEEMLAGAIRVPGFYLDAFAILKRQLAAFTLDRWICESVNSADQGNLKQSLEVLQKNPESDLFPMGWCNYVEINAYDLLSAFLALFPIINSHVSKSLAEFLGLGKASSEKQPFTHWIINEFSEVAKEIDGLVRRIGRIDNELERRKKIYPPPKDFEKEKESLKLERKGLRKIKASLELKDALGFLTETGILPNYAFPEEGMQLKSVLYKRKQKNSEDDLSTRIFEYTRPAAAGLTDFAPTSRFYAEGRRVKIQEINLERSELERWRVCPNCSYMSKLVEGIEENLDRSCQHCGSDRWSDMAQVRDFVRLRQVIASTESNRARIGDEDEERNAQHFERVLVPTYVKKEKHLAYQLATTDLAFGFEFIGDCSFCEVNFGKRKEGAEFKYGAGISNGAGFVICKHCWRVISETKDKSGRPYDDHKVSCPARVGGKEADHLRTAYLYREFRSEAIRILMPIRSLDPDKGMQSFATGLQMGLELHFRGKVDHLKYTILQSEMEGAQRCYLFLYDSIPGGTGYLQQLMHNPEEFKEVFRKALDHMRACSCGDDDQKDGCYRCIYAYREAHKREKTSRSQAIAIFADLVEQWNSLEKIEDVDAIRTNALVESQLEWMFLEQLKVMAESTKEGSLRKIIHNGKLSYRLVLGDNAPKWTVEPQVRLHEQLILHHKTRVDFLFTSPGQLPIAIYLDGWEYHRDQIAQDFAKRLEIVRTGNCRVWLLSFSDLKHELTNKCEKIQHRHFLLEEGFQALEGLQGSSPTLTNLQSFYRSQREQRHAMRTFEEYLRTPSSDQWSNFSALFTAVSMRIGQSLKDPLDVQKELTKLGSEELFHFIEQLKPDRYSLNRADLVRFLGVAIKPSTWLPFLVLDDVNVSSHHMQKSWNTALHYFNLLQFSHQFHIACRSAPNAPLPSMIPVVRSIENRASNEADDWNELRQFCLKELLPLVGELEKAKLALPIAGLELIKQSRVCAEAELAWESEKVVIVSSEHREAFERDHWKIFILKECFENFEPVLAHLRRSS